MPSMISNRLPGMCSAVSRPPRRDQQVVAAVDDQRRRHDAAQQRAAIAGIANNWRHRRRAGLAGRARSARSARRACDAPARVAGRRHDRRQARRALRVTRGDDLRDHPAHRHADQVRLGDLKRVEQSRGVGGHVVERVGRAHRQPQPHPRDLQQQVRPPATSPEAAVAVSKRTTRSRRRQAVDDRVGPRTPGIQARSARPPARRRRRGSF
jgi:hypothetical protein